MRWCLCLFTALLIQGRAVAWETDQFTLPAQSIAETGSEVSRYVFGKLQLTVDLIIDYKATYPSKITTLKKMLVNKKQDIKKTILFTATNGSRRHTERLQREIYQLETAIEKYQYLLELTQTQQGMAELIAQSIGRSIASDEKKDAIWRGTPSFTPYRSGLKDGLRVAYQPDRFDTVYAFAGFHRLLHPSHFVFSSTIKLYGIEMGMDKLGHLFNEGFQYYQQVIMAQNSGLSYQDALEKAVDWGVDSENSYYGVWVSGIYSNADLASNYAGLHFYLNLFSPLQLNGTTYPAILKQDDVGNYRINQTPSNQAITLLKRFISNHMNEALNPSSLEYLQYIFVKKAVLNRCGLWQKRYPDPVMLNDKASNLKYWNEDSYGFKTKNTVSIYESCFISPRQLVDEDRRLVSITPS